ncbi:hypothetical protein T01_6934 [Trichinella spiralis]|uniref:Uncharacterized protein n=1 Tax=Trichinella spiralis TaxID=6334 RepID=A0A0V1BKD9_TRISP|nr:hypothetical protein T01_6934 [Trichinella spiralis]
MRYASVRIGQLDRRTDRHKWTRHNEDKDPGCCQHRWSNICPVRGSWDAFKRPPCLSALFCQLPGQRAPATLRGRERVDLVKADLGNEPIRLRQAENVTVLNDDWSVSTYKVATLRKRRRAAP